MKLRCTGQESALRRGWRGHLGRFQDVETKTPTILTTSQLLTTGGDAPTCKNVVLARVVGSMSEFKQIIGRGTRVRDDYGKLWFNIIDYTGSAIGPWTRSSKGCRNSPNSNERYTAPTPAARELLAAARRAPRLMGLVWLRATTEAVKRNPGSGEGPGFRHGDGRSKPGGWGPPTRDLLELHDLGFRVIAHWAFVTATIMTRLFRLDTNDHHCGSASRATGRVDD